MARSRKFMRRSRTRRSITRRSKKHGRKGKKTSKRYLKGGYDKEEFREKLNFWKRKVGDQEIEEQELPDDQYNAALDVLGKAGTTR